MWKQAIVRELGVVLLLKLTALLLLWLAFFHQPNATTTTRQDVDRLLLGSAQPAVTPPTTH